MSFESHEEFLELCALSTSGDLTWEEISRLNAHLAICPSCREAKQEYEVLAESVLTDLVVEGTDEAPSLPRESEEEFLRRIRAEKRQVEGQGTQPFNPASALGALESTWRGGWALYAAGVLLSIAMGIAAYQYGTRHVRIAADNAGADGKYLAARSEITSLEARLSDAGRELAQARAELSRRDRTIADLRTRFSAQSQDLSQLSTTLAELKRQAQSDSSADAAARQAQVEWAGKLEQVEAENRTLRTQLQSIETQAADERRRAADLAARVDELSDALKQRQSELDQDAQMLAHDRDIRELMGARDLYMAEVYDVARSGETRKPYGRIFYTKEKSLVFYAYDLDQQAGIRNVSTFQAWGRRGPDPERALKLGIFYQDNAAKKRWVMKCDDAKTLAQIDAVFVTVEPNSQSSRPSSKSLLFAYLRIDPNHP